LDEEDSSSSAEEEAEEEDEDNQTGTLDNPEEPLLDSGMKKEL
jgi:hypothetical protein